MPGTQVIKNVPYPRTQFFMGREEEMALLHEALNADQTVALTQAITGLGGIGKTQIALEYTRRYQQDYQAIFWIIGDSRERLLSGFISIAAQLDLPEQNDQDRDRIVESIKRWLREHAGWLLILDNVEDLAAASELLPTAYRGHILLTTRARAVSTLAQSLQVETWQPEVGACFLLRRAGIIPLHASLNDTTEEDQGYAKELSEAMDGLPLALDQAGAYIRMMRRGQKTKYNLSDYLVLYQNQQAKLLNEQGTHSSRDYPLSVETTWSLSFEKVTKANPLATELLQLCAFLSPEPIPEAIILKGGILDRQIILQSLASELNSGIQEHSSDINPALSDLLQMSPSDIQEMSTEVIGLLRDPDSSLAELFTDPSLISEVLESLQGRMGDPDLQAVAQRILNVPNLDLAALLQHMTQSALSEEVILDELLTADALSHPVAPNAIELDREFKEILKFSLVHRKSDSKTLTMHRLVQAVLRNKMDKEEQRKCAERTVRAVTRLFEFVNVEFKTWPLFQQCLPHILTSAALIKEWGIVSSDAADLLTKAGTYLWERGQYAQAGQLHLQALTIHEQLPNAEYSVLFARNLNNLASLYYNQAMYAEAEPLYLRALAIFERVWKSTHWDVPTCLGNLGLVYCQQAKYEQAEEYLQQALALDEQIQGPENLDVAIDLNNLAWLYYELRKYAEAELLYQRALIISEKALELDPRITATSLNGLANLYRDQGMLEEAEQRYQRALLIREQALGPAHIRMADSLVGLAELYWMQGKYEEAEPLYQRALTIRKHTLRSGHPDIARSFHGLANLYRDQGKHAEADSLYLDALSICEKALGPTHPYMRAIQKDYASLLRLMRKEDEAFLLEEQNSSEDL